MFSLRAPRLLLIASVAFAVAACGADKPEVASVGDREVAEADLDQAAALQHVLAELQGAVCGGEPAEGESADTACDRAALSGELIWLAVSPYAEAHDITAGQSAEDAVVQLETQVGGAEELRRSLSARGLTRDDLLELGRKILTIRAVRTAIAEERIGDKADLIAARLDRFHEGSPPPPHAHNRCLQHAAHSQSTRLDAHRDDDTQRR